MQPFGTWRNPAILSYGFRPFFLFGSLYAAAAVAVWVPWFLGFISLPTAFPPVAWHAHELLFGYVPAVIAGFLLTAVASWTGRPPVAGWRLGALFAAWLAGRLAVAGSLALGPLATALATLIFPIAVKAVVAREIIAARNGRNLKVLAIVGGLTVAQALFHWEIWRFGQSVYGDRLAISATLLLIMLIGGRIIPNFTGNWLKARGVARLPAPFSRFDAGAMGLAAVALAAWTVCDAEVADARLVGVLLTAAGCAHTLRALRWVPHLTLSEPLVLILHAAYLFVPAGFLLAGYAAFLGGASHEAAAVHAWTVGAIGTMMLAVMTRASLGHTGRTLTASWPTVAIYVAVIVAAGARIVVALEPRWTMSLMPFAGGAWIIAFLGFSLAYGPMLLAPRR